MHGFPGDIATHCPRPLGWGTTAGSVADGRSLSTVGAECDGPWGRSMSTEGAEEEAGGRAGWGLQTFIPTWRQGRGATPPLKA